MSENKNSMKNIVVVTVAVCLFCSIIVSIAATSLRPLQEENLILERNSNMLAIAGLLDLGAEDAKANVNQLMERVSTKLVDLNNGDFVTTVDPLEYDQLLAADDLASSIALGPAEDVANIKRREHYGKVYFISNNQAIDTIIIPIRGYGLWSTLYGFIALESDGITVRGLGFYEHGETPGLGGEVDNPKWKAKWTGKQVLSDDGELAIAIVKNLNPNDKDIDHKVDALSGASLTSRGVHNLIRYWLGENAYGPFLDKVRNNEVQI